MPDRVEPGWFDLEFIIYLKQNTISGCGSIRVCKKNLCSSDTYRDVIPKLFYGKIKRYQPIEFFFHRIVLFVNLSFFELWRWIPVYRIQKRISDRLASKKFHLVHSGFHTWVNMYLVQKTSLKIILNLICTYKLRFMLSIRLTNSNVSFFYKFIWNQFFVDPVDVVRQVWTDLFFFDQVL